MKKVTLFVLIAFAFYNKANCQITEGNWLVGGNASVDRQVQDLNNSTYTGWNVNIDPDIGFFMSDKFAAGIRGNLYYSYMEVHTSKTKTTFLGFGPFLRYYFLPTGNSVNILADAEYLYGTDFKKNHQEEFIFSAGPVFFLNPSVGLELTLNYHKLNSKITGSSTFSFAVGFQIHLKKKRITRNISGS